MLRHGDDITALCREVGLPQLPLQRSGVSMTAPAAYMGGVTRFSARGKASNDIEVLFYTVNVILGDYRIK